MLVTVTVAPNRLVPLFCACTCSVPFVLDGESAKSAREKAGTADDDDFGDRVKAGRGCGDQEGAALERAVVIHIAAAIRALPEVAALVVRGLGAVVQSCLPVGIIHHGNGRARKQGRVVIGVIRDQARQAGPATCCACRTIVHIVERRLLPLTLTSMLKTR